jgi:hypothetical protein
MGDLSLKVGTSGWLCQFSNDLRGPLLGTCGIHGSQTRDPIPLRNASLHYNRTLRSSQISLESVLVPPDGNASINNTAYPYTARIPLLPADVVRCCWRRHIASIQTLSSPLFSQAAEVLSAHTATSLPAINTLVNPRQPVSTTCSTRRAVHAPGKAMTLTGRWKRWFIHYIPVRHVGDSSGPAFRIVRIVTRVVFELSAVAGFPFHSAEVAELVGAPTSLEDVSKGSLPLVSK